MLGRLAQLHLSGSPLAPPLGQSFRPPLGAERPRRPDPVPALCRHREDDDRVGAGEEDGREFFGRMRDMTAMGFYTTEIGYKELDNPALKFYAESPECPHKDDPEHKHLPPPKY